MNTPNLFSKPPMETIPEDSEAQYPQNLSEDSEAYEAQNAEEKRSELIRLSESGEIKQTERCIRKASNKVVLKIHREYEAKQADNANTFLADTLIAKFADLMNELDLVNRDDSLSEELRKDILLQKNTKTAVSFITPFIPFIGITSGGATLGKHVMKHRNNTSANIVDVTDENK